MSEESLSSWGGSLFQAGYNMMPSVTENYPGIILLHLELTEDGLLLQPGFSRGRRGPSAVGSRSCW